MMTYPACYIRQFCVALEAQPAMTLSLSELNSGVALSPDEMRSIDERPVDFAPRHSSDNHMTGPCYAIVGSNGVIRDVQISLLGKVRRVPALFMREEDALEIAELEDSITGTHHTVRPIMHALEVR